MAWWWPWRSDDQVSRRWLQQQRRLEAATETRDYGVLWLASEDAARLKAEMRRRIQTWRQAREQRRA